MLKSKEYLENLAQQCIDKSKALGATDVEVTLSNSISESLNSRNKKIEHSERSEVLSLGLTTYINKKKSNVSSSNLNKENLFALIERCVECAKVSPDDKYVGLPDKNMMQDKFEDLELYDEKKLSNSFKNEFLKTVEEEMFKNKKIKNSNGSSFSESKSNFIYANSNGFCNGYKTSSYSVFCEALAEENGSMERDYEVSVSRFFENIDKPDFIGKSAAERAIKRLGARKIKSEKLPIIFDKRISKSLLSTRKIKYTRGPNNSLTLLMCASCMPENPWTQTTRGPVSSLICRSLSCESDMGLVENPPSLRIPAVAVSNTELESQKSSIG